MTDETKQIVIERDDAFFGSVLICAVRYCIGRQTYMPSLVTDKIRPMLPLLSFGTLWCFQRDIERASDLGSAEIDKPVWEAFLKAVKEEMGRREGGR